MLPLRRSSSGTVLGRGTTRIGDAPDAAWGVLVEQTALNQPQAGAELWRWLSTICAGDERVKLAKRIREVPYKATSLVALPLAINAATALREAMDDELLEALGEDPRRIDADNYAATLDRARSFWSRIYATFAERAHDRIYKAMPPSPSRDV